MTFKDYGSTLRGKGDVRNILGLLNLGGGGWQKSYEKISNLLFLFFFRSREIISNGPQNLTLESNKGRRGMGGGSISFKICLRNL